jgi:hypothetical protein
MIDLTATGFRVPNDARTDENGACPQRKRDTP